MSELATIHVHIGEMMALIDWHVDLADSLDKVHKDKSKKTMAGITVGEVIAKHRTRARELHNQLNEVWPK